MSQLELNLFLYLLVLLVRLGFVRSPIMGTFDIVLSVCFRRVNVFMLGSEIVNVAWVENYCLPHREKSRQAHFLLLTLLVVESLSEHIASGTGKAFSLHCCSTHGA